MMNSYEKLEAPSAVCKSVFVISPFENKFAETKALTAKLLTSESSIKHFTLSVRNSEFLTYLAEDQR